jgi:serine/threonine-protein kinase RsbW
MTENGTSSTSSPITERSGVSQIAERRVGATEPVGVTEQHGDPQAGGLATATQRASAASGALVRDQVTVRMPADGAYQSVLRTPTAGRAARLDFTLDEIEDMRIAVDEACAMLLSQAIPGSELECTFVLGRDEMTVQVSVRCLAPRVPAGDTFAWTVLSALAGSVDAQVGPGDVLTIVLRKSRDSSRSV